MAIRLHGSARTSPRIRAELQLATGSHRSLAQLYGINPKTVAKWRARTSVLDEPMGPRDRASRHLSQEQEHLAIALRKQGHLSLDIRSRLQLQAHRWKTPFRAICEAWEKDPGRFRLHQHHLTAGLNILVRVLPMRTVCSTAG